ncbi:MAG TPA: filamentous hemagglutinin N-terminal domain-containing protein, partial [Nitrospiraceae bacterium]|nr:filamentous hemagglutinin N-terminal domain-containing protein [Nitrospiraceae bacterium]
MSPTFILCGALLVVTSISHSLAAAPITQSGLNTQVSPPIILPSGQTEYNITGGTRPGGGVNLFHSFGDFNVPTNNIANFLNSGSVDSAGHPLGAGLPTSNILGRIDGGNPSSIFGMIQTNGPGGFPTANLFLMNPYGFLFGPHATVNVGGMVSFTTADYLRFQGTQTLFNKVSTPESLSLLSTVPVAAFGFLGNNPAAIAIQGSTLQVAQGQSLSLVGGNKGFNYTDPDTGNLAPVAVPGGVTMTGGKLLAPGGQINVVSVASPGEVLASILQLQPNVTGASFTSLGNVSIEQDALIDTSVAPGGT